MENLERLKLFSNVYKDTRVLITGHTGFKGSWLAYWLQQMGAIVCGYSTQAPSDPAHFDILKIDIDSNIADIRNEEKFQDVLNKFKPRIVFHLAAQALVRESYDNPIETFETNVIGSLKVYDACRRCDSVDSIVTITTDKVYENNEWTWGYREIDRLGGKDPYSASKAAMEIMTKSFIHSYLHLDQFGKTHNILIGTARAGNVIGGGDWAKDRLIPDIIKASLKKNPVEIRSPYSTRPWQHVLEPLSGYLLLGQKLLERKVNFAQEYNFGPSLTEDISVKEVVEILKNHWDKISYKIVEPKIKLHEAKLLKLDCTKAFTELNWKPIFTADQALSLTIEWYKKYYENQIVSTAQDLNFYIEMATKSNATWCK